MGPIKDLNLLTFVESLMLFFCPSTGNFALSLGRCDLLFVATHLQGRHVRSILEPRQGDARSMQEGRSDSTHFLCSSHLIGIAINRAFLRAQLLRKGGFNPRIRRSGRIFVLYLLSDEMLTGALVTDFCREALRGILALGLLGQGGVDV